MGAGSCLPWIEYAPDGGNFRQALHAGRQRLSAWRFVDSALDAARGEEQWIAPLNHPKDQDLSFHPKNAKTAFWGPLSLGTPVLRKDGAPTSVVG